MILSMETVEICPVHLFFILCTTVAFVSDRL